ncbi:hypothetical protein PVK06_043196 [Gossypium arboreum]|uniref:Uncharacterized protein n=1 Tax=Gossypium arboreum TaxID=29729 RepID=A0ABR0MNA7_GOSAR|nr:hypothetical protein PVK06_043196 [Gossypium arboreum]
MSIRVFIHDITGLLGMCLRSKWSFLLLGLALWASSILARHVSGWPVEHMSLPASSLGIDQHSPPILQLGGIGVEFICH